MKRLLVFLLLFLPMATFAQGTVVPLAWGKVPGEDWAITACDWEPGAQAVVLNNHGELKLNSGGAVLTRHVRIKVLAEEGKNQATITLRYYAEGGLEKIENLEGHTLKPGIAKPIAMSLDNVVEKKESPYWSSITFSLPQVTVGDIIEYRYQHKYTKLYALDTWHFWMPLPTRHAQFRINRRKSSSVNFTYLLQGERLNKAYQFSTQYNSFWALDQLPSIREEVFLDNALNYTDQLSVATTSGQSTQSAVGAWNAFVNGVKNTGLIENYIDKPALYTKTLKQIIQPFHSREEQMALIHNWVANTIVWNGGYTWLPLEGNPAKVLNAKRGYSAEKNLLLAGLLKTQGFNVYPVLSSTKAHGQITKEFPNIKEFNHLMCLVDLGGRRVVLDATLPGHSWNLPPLNSLNGEGLVIREYNEIMWQALAPATPLNKTTFALTMNMAADGSTSLNATLKYQGYHAVEALRQLGNGQELEEHLADFMTLGDGNFALDSLTVEGLGGASLEKVTLSAKLSSNFANSPNRYYIQPIRLPQTSRNPFPDVARMYPIDLGHAEQYQLYAQINLPEGFVLESAPAPESFSLPGGAGLFTFQVQQQGLQVVISARIDMRQSRFAAEDYSALRAFYDQIIKKLEQPLVVAKA